MSRKKITVVGAGNVGATCAQRLAERDYADVVLVDIVDGIPQGKALDLNQAGPIVGYEPNVVGTVGYEETAGSDIVALLVFIRLEEYNYGAAAAIATVMLAMAFVMLIVTNVISVVQKTWSRTNSKVSEFREARMAFDLIARNLSQAVLNTYWQSMDNSGSPTSTFQTLNDRQGTIATAYVRQSELEFVTGQAAQVVFASAFVSDTS